MKIAVIHFGKKGAGPAISFEMARALSRQGHSVSYYASEQVENRSYVEMENFKTYFFNTYDSKFTYLKSIIFSKQIKKIVKALMEEKPDVVYSPMNDLWLPFIYPKLKNTLRVKTIHDVGVHEGNNSLFNRWWNSSNFRDAEKYIILSHKYVNDLLSRGIAKEDIAVIPHAGFDYYANLSEEQSVDCQSNLLFFGRIDKYKGIDILLDAMEIVVKSNPTVILNIVGNGDLSKYTRKINQLSKNIRVYNRWIRDEEVAGFIKQTDIVVLPYTHATQSGVIPLAYAFSKPVVATDVGCLDEQVLDGKSGLLVKDVAASSFAGAIQNLLDNPQLTRKMGIYAHKFMKENLTWKISAERLINFIND